jgi:hypothetical protein
VKKLKASLAGAPTPTKRSNASGQFIAVKSSRKRPGPPRNSKA